MHARLDAGMFFFARLIDRNFSQFPGAVVRMPKASVPRLSARSPALMSKPPLPPPPAPREGPGEGY